MSLLAQYQVSGQDAGASRDINASCPWCGLPLTAVSASETQVGAVLLVDPDFTEHGADLQLLGIGAVIMHDAVVL